MISLQTGQANPFRSYRDIATVAAMMSLFRTYRYPLLSGLLLGLSGAQVGPPPLTLGLSWLVWVGAIPWLLWLWRGQHPFRHAALGSGIVGLVWHAITLHWMLWLHPLTWTGVSSAVSAAIAVGAWLLWSSLGGVAMVFAGLAAAWLAQWCQRGNGATYYHKALWVLGLALLWPWAHIGLAALTDIYIVWVDPVTPLAAWPGIRGLLGHMPLTLLWSVVLVINGALAWAFTRRKHCTKHVAILAFITQQAIITLLAILFIINPIGLLLDVPANRFAGGLHTPWVIVQKNLPISAIRAPAAKTPSPTAYLTHLHTAEYLPGTTIILPEEGILRGWVPLENPTSNPDYRALQALARTRQWTIITGASTHTTPPHSSALHPPTILFNSLLVLSPHNTQAYHKHTRVPFGETLPNGLRLFSKTPLNGWLYRLANTVHFPYIPLFTAGALSQPPLTPNNTLSLHPSICFELALKPYQPPTSHASPTTWMVNVSNLGWFHGNQALARQFWQKGQLAAAVHHQPLAIAANTGPSGIIDATGAPATNTPLPLNTNTTGGWTSAVAP